MPSCSLQVSPMASNKAMTWHVATSQRSPGANADTSHLRHRGQLDIPSTDLMSP